MFTRFEATGIPVMFISVVISIFLVCASRKIVIEVQHDYTRERFSGRDLNSKVIGICPVLLKTGPVPDTVLQFTNVVRKVGKDRNDLNIMTSDTVGHILAGRLTEKTLKEYYHKLYAGEISFMQTADTFWGAVPSEYLLVPRLIHGMDIRTFYKKIRKKFRLEVELWEREGMEVVWRLTVNCSSDDRTITDQELLQNSLEKVLREFPVAIPNYEPGKW